MKDRLLRWLSSYGKLGLRIVKTGVAVTLCMVFCELLHQEHAFVAVVTAALSMGRNLDSSVRAGKDRLLGAVLGATLGGLFYHISPQNAGLCGVGIILVLYLCQVLRLREGGLIGCFLFAMVLLHPSTASTFWTVGSCLLAAGLGILVAFAVNFLLLPPNYAGKIFALDEQIRAQLATCAKVCESRLAKPDIDAVQRTLAALKEDIRLYVSEWRLFRNRDKAVFAIARRAKTYEAILTDLLVIAQLRPKLDNETATVLAYHLNRTYVALEEVQKAAKDEA